MRVFGTAILRKRFVSRNSIAVQLPSDDYRTQKRYGRFAVKSYSILVRCHTGQIHAELGGKHSGRGLFYRSKIQKKTIGGAASRMRDNGRELSMKITKQKLKLKR